ncbi:hypothetical protein [Corynebacterium accolens]|uniref:hypothetical protein n=1 Tax=Corynebacterium accolens TaxID=38284 RepID=UPI00266FB6CD|nr:hypothetical protein [Corynebacterium accolens]WKS60335.1 hypothetical protein NLL43_11290 [Corynebacterium accolens]
MALTDEDFELLGSLRGMRVFATTLQEIVNDPSRDLDSFEDKIKEALDAPSIGMVSPVDFEAQLADQNGNKKAAA